MIFIAMEEAARNGELILVHGGLCRFHRRRDGNTIIREILVLPEYRRSGIGRRLLAEVISRRGDGPVIAKCPKGYEANLFWAAMGFEIAGETERLFQWEYRV